MTPPLSARFGHALAWANTLHGEQRRKGSGIPYMSHLLSVTALVIEHGGTEEEAIAALLHDAVEDAGGLETLAEIRRRFGEMVAETVAACSDSEGPPKPPWIERKKAYLEHLAAASQSTLLVSSCDKLHNARSILTDLRDDGESVWDRFNGGREGTLWYYRAVTDTLRAHGAPPRIIDELDATVRLIETFA